MYFKPNFNAEADKDLVYNMTNGEQVNITGILTTIRNKPKDQEEAERFKLKINHLEANKDNKIVLTDNDKEEFEALAGNGEIIPILLNSLVPNLVISDQIKLGILTLIVFFYVCTLNLISTVFNFLYFILFKDFPRFF